MLLKNTLMEIKQSFGRYITIFIIIALGVALYTGLNVTMTDMVETGNVYLKESNFHDYRIMNTLGCTPDDVAEILKIEGVEYAEGTYFTDVLADIGSSQSIVIKVHTITENINTLHLKAGRLPKNDNECVADAAFFSGSAIGQKISLTDENEEDTLETFKHKDLTVVGIADSPLYMNFERGSAAVGNGRVDAFIFVPYSAFDIDYFTDIYVTFEEKADIYTHEHEDILDKYEPVLEALAEKRAGIRYNDVIVEANDALAEAEVELADGRAEYEDAVKKLNDAEEEINDARRKLDDGWQEYNDGMQEYIDGKAEFETEIADARKELDDGWAELDDAYKELMDGEDEFSDGLGEFNEGLDEFYDGLDEYNKGVEELEKGKRKLESARKQLAAASQQLNAAKAELEAQEENYNGLAGVLNIVNGIVMADPSDTITSAADVLALPDDILNGMLTGLPVDATTIKTTWNAVEMQAGMTLDSNGYAAFLAGVRTQLDNGWIEYNNGLSAYQSGRAQYNRGVRELRDAEEKLADAKAEIDDAQIEIDDAWLEVEDGRTELDDGWEEYLDGEKELIDGEKTLKEETEKGLKELADAEIELADALIELQDGEREYADGYREYMDARAEADVELADALVKIEDGEKELADAKEEIAELEYPTVYALTRFMNTGYACFDNDTAILEGIVAVFPAFFLLIAALVCITTMTRMVDENRGQIGTLKALGYSKGAIMSKFLIYSGSASLLGCIVGFFVGGIVFPEIIWMAYGMMYGFSDEIVIIFDYKLGILSTLAFLACALGATYFSCYTELSEVPAQIMRPRAPKTGKRILLERITPLWQRMSFLYKVSARNIFRYKKRLFMMIVGIAGSCALLLTGFGINDSIKDVVNYQFGEISLYDYEVTFSKELSAEERSEFELQCGDALGGVKYMHKSSADIVFDSRQKSSNLIVPTDGTMETYFYFHDDGKPVSFPGNGEIVVNVGLAEGLGISVGDTVELKDADLNTMTLTVSGIIENYVDNYVFISTKTYTEKMGKAPEIKSAYMYAGDGIDIHEAATTIMNADNVGNVSVTDDMKDRINDMLGSLNYIVILIIVCAGALSFAVIYNLTNINITDRIREIATIKVLGFNSMETAQYVFRENIIMTIMSTFVGLVLGKLFHAYVMAQVKIDTMHFDVRISVLSYTIAAVLTLVFSVIVAFFMYFKLQKINMAESLKSIE